jgi:hypothetical protein
MLRLVFELVHGGYTLEELIADVTTDNRWEEWNLGPPVGREIW